MAGPGQGSRKAAPALHPARCRTCPGCSRCRRRRRPRSRPARTRGGRRRAPAPASRRPWRWAAAPDPREVGRRVLRVAVAGDPQDGDRRTDSRRVVRRDDAPGRRRHSVASGRLRELATGGRSFRRRSRHLGGVEARPRLRAEDHVAHQQRVAAGGRPAGTSSPDVSNLPAKRGGSRAGACAPPAPVISALWTDGPTVEQVRDRVLPGLGVHDLGRDARRRAAHQASTTRREVWEGPVACRIRRAAREQEVERVLAVRRHPLQDRHVEGVEPSRTATRTRSGCSRR